MQKKAVLSALLLTAAAAAAYAQKDVTSMLSTTHSTLKSIVSPALNIISVVIGLIGVFMLGPDMAKFMKGEGTASDSLLKHAGGFLIAIILLQIIRVTVLS